MRHKGGRCTSSRIGAHEMTTTIQQTGKGLKAALLVSRCAIIAGPVIIFAGKPIGMAVFVLGLVGLVVTRSLILWNHE